MGTVRPLSPCTYAGCRCYAVSGQRYCKKHLEQVRLERNARDKQRGTRTQRGYSNSWLRLSRAYLMLHPLCVECQRNGIIKPATEVDHIVPHKGNKDLFWSEANLQALCHECHSKKTASQDGGFDNLIKNTPRG